MFSFFDDLKKANLLTVGVEKEVQLKQIIGVANYFFLWLYRCTGTIVQETKIANKKAYNWKVIDDPCINLKYDCTIVLVPLYLVQIIQEYR